MYKAPALFNNVLEYVQAAGENKIFMIGLKTRFKMKI